MPKFEAASVVEPLNYDFAPYVAASGVIDEPNDRLVGTFMAGLQSLMKTGLGQMGLDAKDLADAAEDPDKMMEAISGLQPDEYVKVMDQMADLHAKLCGGRPTKAQLLKLPLRVRVLFYGWLQREVMSPEAATPAGIAAVTPLQRAAGG